MTGIFESLRDGLATLGDPARIYPLIQAVLLLLSGWFLARAARFAVLRAFRHLAPQQLVLASRAVYGLVFILFAVSAMRELGFDFAVLLGAAGIVTVAVGFASQTSASNVISGLFMVLERAVIVGDVIRVGTTTGEVLSIDLLSTKLRTFDNLLVRIPNETMVKAEITTLNRFPIRRVDLPIGVAYKEDLKKVRDVLMAVAARNPLCLEEPAPNLIAQGFGASSIDYQFSVWAKTEKWLELKNSMQAEVKAAFDREGVEIPFPHQSLYAGSATEPLPIRLIHGPAPAGSDLVSAGIAGTDEDAEPDPGEPDERSEKP